jgi:hypothetical protein
MLDNILKVLLIAWMSYFLLGYVTAVEAFDTYGWPFGKRNVHKEITEEALKDFGFSHYALKRINQAGRYQDLKLIKFAGISWFIFGYRPEYHFDRYGWNESGKQGHIIAFARGRNYVNKQKHEIIKLLREDPHDKYIKALDKLGYALHALQDFFAHSNYVDLAEQDKITVDEALRDSSKAPPHSLKITGYMTSFKDEYPHGLPGKGYNKDNECCSKKAGGRAAFFKAKFEAIQHTEEFVKDLRNLLSAEEWNKLTSCGF